IILPKHKTIGGQLLINNTELVKAEVIKAAQLDLDSVIAVFDG
ncbi:6398_t:CDS:1, partial [Racocetra persica]